MAGDVIRKGTIEIDYRVDSSQLQTAENAVKGLTAPIEQLINNVKDLSNKIASLGTRIASTVSVSSSAVNSW